MCLRFVSRHLGFLSPVSSDGVTVDTIEKCHLKTPVAGILFLAVEWKPRYTWCRFTPLMHLVTKVCKKTFVI